MLLKRSGKKPSASTGPSFFGGVWEGAEDILRSLGRANGEMRMRVKDGEGRGG